MNRSRLLAVLLPLALAACGGTDVVVTAAIEVQDPEAEEATTIRALSDVPVHLLPYDRDEIFDSLTQAAPRPEPQIPDSILAVQDTIAAWRERWNQAEARWSVLRDTLQDISAQLRRLNRGEGRYRVLFRDFQEMEQQLSAVERRRDEAFRRFDELQRSVAQQTAEIRLRREEWADEAFADVPDVIEARLRATGLDPRTDTTDAGGVVRFGDVPAGRWWVHARQELPYTELYWNVPVEVEGDVLEIRLDRENAEVRPKL